MYMDTDTGEREIYPRFHEKIEPQNHEKYEDNLARTFRMRLYINILERSTAFREEKKWSEEKVWDDGIYPWLFDHGYSIAEN